MIVQVEKFMRKWNMVPEGGRVLVGVSGGADSVCLCLILYELSTKMNFSLEVIHVEHGIRGEESKNDAVFVEQLCKQRGIVCHIRNVDVPRYAKIHHLGEEEAARILRYQVFADAAGQDRNVRIALAHHMEDNAETMLFQLIRGSGLDGLCGMRPQRTGTNGEIYIRPFLQCSREQIEQFLEERGQGYCTDSTNANESYSRNRMRKRVLPELIQMNPQAVQHMQTAMEQLQQVRDYLEEETVSLEKKIYFRGEEKCETGYGRAGRAFAGCPDAADPQSCLESCRGMQRYYGGTFAGSGGPSGKTDRKICKTALWADRHKSLQCDRNHGKKKGNGKDLSADRYGPAAGKSAGR